MSMNNEAYMVPNPMTPCRAVIIDAELCIGCNQCVDVCRTDVLMPNPEKGQPPILLYPDECWFCGCCVTFCPQAEKGAIRIVTPFQMRGSFKKERA